MKNECCKILNDGKESFNFFLFFFHAMRGTSYRAREFPIAIWCIGFGDGGLMHTSHLVNARRKTGRERRGGGMHEVAPKRLSSGSLRPFSFRRVASFSPVPLARSCKSFDEFADGIREAIKPGDGASFKKGRASRITRVWEKTIGFRIAQKRLQRSIIISRGDTPFWLTTTLPLKWHDLN